MSQTAQNMLRDYASSRWPDLNHKGRMQQLARLLGLGSRRVKSIYHNEETARLRADELERIEALKEEANRNEYQSLQDRIARLEAALFSQDEEFHQHQVAGFRQAVDFGRGGNVPRDAQGMEGESE